MNKEDAHIVVAMANHNMNVTDVARAIFAHRNTVLYHLDKVKQQTGLDPRRFYDLVELVKMVVFGTTFWKSSATMFLMRSEPRRTTGTARTWFLTTSRQSSLSITP